MKDEKQENAETQILEVEHLFFATIGGNELLFVKAKNDESVIFKLRQDFLKVFLSDVQKEPG